MTFDQGSFIKDKSYDFEMGEMTYSTTHLGLITENIYIVTTEENKKQNFTKKEFDLFFNLEKEGA